MNTLQSQYAQKWPKMAFQNGIFPYFIVCFPAADGADYPFGLHILILTCFSQYPASWHYLGFLPHLRQILWRLPHPHTDDTTSMRSYSHPSLTAFEVDTVHIHMRVLAALQGAVAPGLDVDIGFLVQFADGGGGHLAAP